MEYLFYYMAPTPNKIWEDKGYQNTANFGQNTSFFCKLHLNYNLISSYSYLVNHFILF